LNRGKQAIPERQVEQLLLPAVDATSGCGRLYLNDLHWHRANCWCRGERQCRDGRRRLLVGDIAPDRLMRSEGRYTAAARSPDVDGRNECMRLFFCEPDTERILRRLECQRGSVSDACGFKRDEFAGRKRLADLHLVRSHGVREGAFGQPDADSCMPVKHQHGRVQAGSFQCSGKQK
jgi:hypothetical protein